MLGLVWIWVKSSVQIVIMLTQARPTVLSMHMSMLYMHICFQYDTERNGSGMSDYGDSGLPHDDKAYSSQVCA